MPKATHVSNAELEQDIRRVAELKGGEPLSLSRSEYLQHGNYSAYQIYDGGRTWEELCSAAGVASKRIQEVDDSVYFERLRKAIRSLGRLPKTSERKDWGLNFSKRRYPTLTAFVVHAAKSGEIDRCYGRTIPRSHLRLLSQHRQPRP